MSNARCYLGEGLYVCLDEDLNPDAPRGWDGARLWTAAPPRDGVRMGDERPSGDIGVSPEQMRNLLIWWERELGELHSAAIESRIAAALEALDDYYSEGGTASSNIDRARRALRGGTSQGDLATPHDVRQEERGQTRVEPRPFDGVQAEIQQALARVAELERALNAASNVGTDDEDGHCAVCLEPYGEEHMTGCCIGAALTPKPEAGR